MSPMEPVFPPAATVALDAVRTEARLAPPSTPPRPQLSVGHVISRTFSIWLGNAGAFSAVALVVYAPAILLAFAGVGRGSLWRYVLANILGLVTSGALTAGVLQALRGERLGVGRMLGIGLRKVFPLLGVSLIQGLLVGCGLLLLVVPGLIAFAGCYVAVPALVAEDLGMSAAIQRSWDLTYLRRGNILAVALLMPLGGAVVGFGLAVPIAMIAAGLTGRVGNEAFGVIEIVGVLAAVVARVAPAVAYHDLRVEKEGVGTGELAAVFE